MTVTPPARVFVGLGGNVGDRWATLRSAASALATDIPQTVLSAVSRVYETRPVGPSPDPFLNAVAELHTLLPPASLLRALLAIEAAHGRRRTARWEARTLDLDILVWLAAPAGTYVATTIAEPGLTVPHPRATERDFVLRPLSDLLGDVAIVDQRSATQLLAALPPSEQTILGVIPGALWTPQS